MKETAARKPEVEIVFVDPATGTEGFLVIDRLYKGVSAGGLRIHENLEIAELRRLALGNATLRVSVQLIRARLDDDVARRQGACGPGDEQEEEEEHLGDRPGPGAPCRPSARATACAERWTPPVST